MQIAESEFNYNTAKGALDQLSELIKGPRTDPSGFAELNALKIVKGWLLKRAALEALEQPRDSMRNEVLPEVEIFCDFLVNEAFYYD